MASIQINRGNSQEINNTPITDGLILFNTTNKTIYMDNENNRDVYSGQLSNSSDVEIVNLSDGQIIIWDATNNKWKNTDRYFEINNLTDVNLNSLANGQILKYDETSEEWINTDYTINDLSNVDINLSTLADGQIIVYNATTNKWENSEVKGGHKILNDSGTTLTQKDNLQFKGVYTQNNGDNTEVDICRTMTKAQMEALSGEALKGFINTSDEPDSLPLTAEWVAYGNGSVKDGLDNKVSKTGDTITGNLFVRKSSGDSNVVLGGNSSRGVSRYYDETGHFVDVYPNTITTNRAITLPDKGGTIALTSDLIPTKTQFTPNYGASSDYASRNFFVTDNSTFLDIHFCLHCTTAINANIDLVTLPTNARNKIPQYGVGVETSNNKAHLVYNSGNYMYLDGANITADFNGVFSGTFRMSLI